MFRHFCASEGKSCSEWQTGVEKLFPPNRTFSVMGNTLLRQRYRSNSHLNTWSITT